MRGFRISWTTCESVTTANTFEQFGYVRHDHRPLLSIIASLLRAGIDSVGPLSTSAGWVYGEPGFF